MKLQGYQTGISTLDELIRAVDFLQSDLKKLMNNGLQFDDNMNFYEFSHTFSSADTSEAISHSLGKTPVGWLMSYQDKDASIYTSGTAPWTDTEFQLKCSTNGTAIKGFLF